MRSFLTLVLCGSALTASCTRAAGDPAERKYPLQGQVQALEPARKLITLKHGDIKGFMPAMTMPYEVRDAAALAGLAPGDLIDATLVVVSNGAFVTDIRKVGAAPLDTPPPAPPSPRASSGFELLMPGDPVPAGAFVDQDGRLRSFADFKGAPLVVTFIYTKCPLPTFCPLMDRHFAAMQKPLKTDPLLKSVHLVTISFDPATDSPLVLKTHAKSLDADLARWTFLTGDRDDIDRFAARFGVSVSRALNDPRDITHNLRTAIVDADGRLVKVYTGNEWTPEVVLNDLKGVVRAG
jgi:protein SCO1/2